LKTLHVAVGVIRNDRGEVLIARRLESQAHGGWWEFPGGKVESGERVQQALRRELREELDLEAGRIRRLIRIGHAYPDYRVSLDVWQVTGFQGEAKSMLGQELAWVPADQLQEHALLPANRPIVAAARLPDFHVIVDISQIGPEALIEHLRRLAERRISLIQLRGHELPAHQYRSLATQALRECRSLNIRCLLNAAPELVADLEADGVHLTRHRLRALRRRPLPESLWVGASCHDPEELRQAREIGVDFALLSPVHATASHPDARPIGWRRFREWLDDANLPVYAFGGVGPRHLRIARTCGARGVAGIRAFLE
jgi:8-oxo-dGTP diphosphatase